MMPLRDPDSTIHTPVTLSPADPLTRTVTVLHREILIQIFLSSVHDVPTILRALTTWATRTCVLYLTSALLPPISHRLYSPSILEGTALPSRMKAGHTLATRFLATPAYHGERHGLKTMTSFLGRLGHRISRCLHHGNFHPVVPGRQTMLHQPQVRVPSALPCVRLSAK